MEITFWGVRGSIATSGPAFARFGGNTTCIEVACDRDRLILDAGTGLRALGDKLCREAKMLGRRIAATFFFSHLHWDHIQGFPFFAPAFRPDTALSLYGSRDALCGGLEDALARQMQPPSFPVPLSAMAAEKQFHNIQSGDGIERGPFLVKTRALCHPQGSLGYRIEVGGKRFCFATDVEHRTDGIDEAILELARDVDLLVYDAQYTVAEYEGREGPPRKGWGHSTYVAAAEIAKAAGVKALALTHHDPTHDDAIVEAIESEAKALFPNTFAAREGLTVRL
ncbi:MAG: MBL fold metallo-hydrolase [Deltaproteobacteria bacterium]|nr:MBL fold metallo-hydrolase [Deltaproteobacteria bacterium]